jgi:hypothetical protein
MFSSTTQSYGHIQCHELTNVINYEIIRPCHVLVWGFDTKVSPIRMGEYILTQNVCENLNLGFRFNIACKHSKLLSIMNQWFNMTIRIDNDASHGIFFHDITQRFQFYINCNPFFIAHCCHL